MPSSGTNTKNQKISGIRAGIFFSPNFSPTLRSRQGLSRPISANLKMGATAPLSLSSLKIASSGGGFRSLLAHWLSGPTSRLVDGRVH